MASQDLPQQNIPTAPVAPLADEPSQGSQSILNTTSTEHVAATGEDPGTGVSVNDPVTSKPAGETQPLASPSANGPSTASLAATEPEAPLEAQKAESEARAEPHTGEKRNIDSATTPAPASVSEDKDEPVPEKSPQPESKKQKTNQELDDGTSGPALAAAAGDTNGVPKKAGRPKREKVKDVVKKAIPGDGIGSRTRSRTKPT